MDRVHALPFIALLTAALGPGSAAAVSPTLCGDALELDPADVVSASLTDGDPAMVDVRSQLGASWFPFMGNTMCLLSTGIAADVELGQDYDWPGTGANTSAGDDITLTWELAVPPWANSLWIRSNFFTREYPEWVGDAYNDTLEMWLAGAAYTGPILFDFYGNQVTVNNAFFVVTDPTLLTGTGFDNDGATGWLVTAAPVQGGDVITLSVSLYDVADGMWDSAALIDFFQWSNATVQLPYTTQADDDGLPTDGLPPLLDRPESTFVTPKTVPLDGGVPLTVKGQLFTAGLPAYLGGVEVSYDLLDDETLRIASAPSALELGLPGGGPVHLQVGQLSLSAAVTYVDVSAAPRIDSIPRTWIPAHTAGDIVVDGKNLAGAYWEFVGEEQTWAPTAVSFGGEAEDGTQRVVLLAPPLPPGLVTVRAFTRDRGEASQLLVVREAPREPADPGDPDAASTSCAQGAGSPSWLALLLFLFPLRRRAGCMRRCDPT